MADLVTHLGRALTGRYFVPSADDEPRFIVENLVEATGSGRAAARYLGVAESTFRGWRHGVTPKRSRRELAGAARRAWAGQAGIYDDAYRGDISLAITGLVKASSDERFRTIYPGRYIPRQVMQGILRAWGAADDDQTDHLLHGAINSYYTQVEFTTIVNLWFE